MVGGFEPEAKPWVAPDALPYPFEFQLLDEDWDHFAILMDSALARIPVLAETGIKKFYNGPESFTPDNQFILGEAPELRNFFVARRLQLGRHRVRRAAPGRALAEWIVEGEPTTWTCPRSTSAASPRSTATTSGCTTGSARCWACTTPCRGRTASWPRARPFRRSPAYHLLHAGQRRASAARWAGSGPNFFAPPGQRPGIEYAWGKQNWQPWSSAEQRAARTGVALFDQTSFSKYLVTGRDAEQVLQWLCTADVAVAAGPDRLHRDAQRPRHLRGRHHRHPAVGR